MSNSNNLKIWASKYISDHALCPKCNHNSYDSTLVQYMVDPSNLSAFKDENRCTCHKCGDVHTVHERVPFTEEFIKAEQSNRNQEFWTYR